MRRKILVSVLLIFILLGGGFGYYYYYTSTNFIKTENAAIAADMVTLTPIISGNLLIWDVKEGDQVSKGQLLGRQDTGALLSSSDINLKTLNNSADALMNKADIKAPINGQIVKSYVIPGQPLAPGMEIAVIADINKSYVLANIEETYIFKVKNGQKVDLLVDAYPNKHFTGEVKSIGQASQSAFNTMPSLNTSGTFSKTTQLIPVKIQLNNDENLPMLLGMNVTVKIHIK